MVCPLPFVRLEYDASFLLAENVLNNIEPLVGRVVLENTPDLTFHAVEMLLVLTPHLPLHGLENLDRARVVPEQVEDALSAFSGIACALDRRLGGFGYHDVITRYVAATDRFGPSNKFFSQPLRRVAFSFNY